MSSHIKSSIKLIQMTNRDIVPHAKTAVAIRVTIRIIEREHS